MNPIKAFDNSLKHPVKAMLAKLIGKRYKSRRCSDKAYTVATWRGVEYLVDVKDKK
jgi:hypothetical protein